MSEPITNLPDAVREFGALPMQMGPEPLALTEAQIEALAAAGNRVVNNMRHEDLCMCDAWPKSCLSSGNFHMGDWDMSGLESALPAVLALWEQMRGGELVTLRARVAELEAAQGTVYRAEHPDSGITLGHYGTEAGARKHCEATERDSWPTGTTLVFDWIEDEEDRVAELVVTAGQNEESATGYIVTALEAPSEYDEEADE